MTKYYVVHIPTGRRLGLSEDFLEEAKYELETGIGFQPCFISFSSLDNTFNLWSVPASNRIQAHKEEFEIIELQND